MLEKQKKAASEFINKGLSIDGNLSKSQSVFFFLSVFIPAFICAIYMAAALSIVAMIDFLSFVFPCFAAVIAGWGIILKYDKKEAAAKGGSDEKEGEVNEKIFFDIAGIALYFAFLLHIPGAGCGLSALIIYAALTVPLVLWTAYFKGAKTAPSSGTVTLAIFSSVLSLVLALLFFNGGSLIMKCQEVTG